MLNASKDLDGYKKHDGITVKLRNLNASKKLESENTLRDRSKKANFECQQTTGKLNNTM